MQNFDEYLKKAEADFIELRSKTKKPRILVLGGTGAGKSSLINIVLKNDVAIVDAGEPTTKGINRYENEHIIIYDSEGYELGDNNLKKFDSLIFDEFIDKENSQQGKYIHFAWYCISAASARFTDNDLHIIKSVQEHGVNLAIIITQIDVSNKSTLKDLQTEIHSKLPSAEIFFTTTDENLANNISSNPENPFANGADALYQWCIDHLDDSLRFEFIAASNRNLNAKENLGEKIIYEHVIAAFGIAFQPLPVADAPLLLAQQTTLAYRLASLWNLDGVIKLIINSGIQQYFLKTLGKMAAASLLKLFPGIGQVISGAINGCVAGALTYAYGLTLNTTFKKINRDNLAESICEMSTYFGDNFIQALKDNFGKASKDKSFLDKILNKK